MFQQFLESKKQFVELNEVQKQAVQHTEGPLLLLASPGSGKTTTMIMRLGHLIQCHRVRPERLIAVSFSRASANDMAERYRRFFSDLPQMKFSTIHSLAFQIVRTALTNQGISFFIIEGMEEQAEEGNDDSATSDRLLSASDQRFSQNNKISKHQLLTELFIKTNGNRPKEDQMDELKRYISFVKNKMLPQDQWSSVSCNIRNAAEILKLYEQRKQKDAREVLLDYDDMLVYAEKYLREDITLRQMYQNRYDYVMSDESQDTSLVQHEIISLLVEKHQNICIVADDDQSIYSWRGAEPTYLLQFEKHYPGAKILFMQQNYRSAQNIVEVANHFIKRNRNRYPKSMFTENKAAEPIKIIQHMNASQEAASIADSITKQIKFNEIAVLYRNHSSSLLLMHELNRRGIPFYMKDADDRFFNHWVVEDVLNMMRLSYTDRRFELFEKVVVKLKTYLSKQQLNELRLKHSDQSLFQLILEHLQLKSYQQLRIQEIQQHIATLKALKPQKAISIIRNELGYEHSLLEISQKFGFQHDYLITILDSLEAIAEGLDTLEQFAARLKELEALQKKARKKRQWDAVTLSTLHSAKGLEFDKVYVIDLIQNVLPSKQDMARPELLEEATRLFYVGITRARTQLELHYVSSWQGNAAEPSIFVEEVRQLIMLNHQPSAKTKQEGKRSLQNEHSEKKLTEQDQQWLISGIHILHNHELKVGLEIEHKQLGTGIIIDLPNEKVTIDFEQQGKKTFQKEFLLERRLLKII